MPPRKTAMQVPASPEEKSSPVVTPEIAEPATTMPENTEIQGASESEANAAPENPVTPSVAKTVSVRAPGGSFRRCGFRFGSEPTQLDIAVIGTEILARLQSEPNLVVAFDQATDTDA